jgi:hypothetical protein
MEPAITSQPADHRNAARLGNFTSAHLGKFEPALTAMTLLPRGVKVHLAIDVIDMRKGLDGLAMLVQGVLRHDPFSGHLFVFRGRRANLIKIVY